MPFPHSMGIAPYLNAVKDFLSLCFLNLRIPEAFPLTMVCNPAGIMKAKRKAVRGVRKAG